MPEFAASICMDCIWQLRVMTHLLQVKAMRAVLRDTNHEESELEISDASVEPPR